LLSSNAMTRSTCAILALLFAAGCGGSTGSGSAPDAAVGGGAGTGGATGGSGGTATGGSGGTATGGSGGTATGGSGGTATGGSAGVDAGLCGPDAKTCAQPGDCVLTESSCCVCGQAELTDYVAVNQAHTSECACQGPVCGCATMLNPNLAATCNAGSCAGFDVRQVDALSACTGDADCTLRIGLDCCEGCQSNGYDLVAVSIDSGGALSQALCDSGGVGCPDCAPQYPANKKAACVANHCAVVDQ
jgi:hypothetical protein